MPIRFGINAFILGVIPWNVWMINPISQIGRLNTSTRETSSKLHKVRSEWENKRESDHQQLPLWPMGKMGWN